MTASIHQIHPQAIPEHLSPAYFAPVGGPINGTRHADHRCDFERLQEDMRTAWAFATEHHLAVLQVSGDRNGAYLVVAPSAGVEKLFGEEICHWVARTGNGMINELWLGCIGHIRVFWRTVKCAAH
jgi:hypothetical protein